MYLKVDEQNNIIEFPYPLSKLKIDYPKTVFTRSPSAQTLSRFGIYFVSDENRPTIDNSTQSLVETEPQYSNGQWFRTWEIVDYNNETIESQLQARRTEMIVTPRQARLALAQLGLLDTVNTALNNLEEPDKTLALIEWEYATTVDRLSQWVVQLTGALGMTAEQVDQLFELASTL